MNGLNLNTTNRDDIWISNFWKMIRSLFSSVFVLSSGSNLSGISELLANQRIERCPGLFIWNMERMECLGMWVVYNGKPY